MGRRALLRLTEPAPMSFADPPAAPSRATKVRYLIIAAATLAAVLLYLERVCLAVAATYIREDLRLTPTELGLALSVFFWAYAIGQVPTGWFSDRYGPRRMMVVYLVAWSLFGILIALATDFWTLVAARLALGLFQAGAYPTLAILLKRWVPEDFRATANSLVAFGGRFGGAGANLLTAWLIVWCVPMSTPTAVRPELVLDPPKLVRSVLDGTPGKPPNPVRPLVAERLWSFFPGDSLETLRRDWEARVAASAAGETATPPAPPAKPSPEQMEEIVAAMNGFITSRIDVGPLPKGVQLTSDATAILKIAPDKRTDVEFHRLNRLLIEKAYPDTIEQLHVKGWRPTLIIFGVAGVVVGMIFWGIVRDWPREHPRCNTEEVALISGGAAPAAATSPPPVPWGLMLTSPNVIFSSLMQFGVNVGWTFIITLMPEYLSQQFQVPVEERGLMATMPLIGGCTGMLLGGWLTDRLTRAFGLRWGRGVFLGPSKLVGACALFACPFLSDPWHVTWMLTFFAFSTDMGIPSTWAFAQDTGGKHVGSVLGWGNMWGNFGAGLAPLLSMVIMQRWMSGWNAVFFVNAGAFLFAAIFGSMMDCRIPLEPAPEEGQDPETDA